MRFNPDAETVTEAKEYLLNRAKQLSVDNITFSGFEDSVGLRFPGVVTAHFLCQETKISYVSFYILKQYRGKGTYEKVVKYINKPIITSPSCNLARFLQIKGIKYRLACHFQYWDEYQLIQSVYSNTKAKRSGLYYINHIDEGLLILKRINAHNWAERAFCLHPICQIDSEWAKHANIQITKVPNVMGLAVEYRNVANAYLSPMGRRNPKDIQLSPIKEVNDMLIADKIQNRKDFELHREKYSNAIDLDYYFKAWLERLEVSEEYYQNMKKVLST